MQETVLLHFSLFFKKIFLNYHIWQAFLNRASFTRNTLLEKKSCYNMSFIYVQCEYLGSKNPNSWWKMYPELHYIEF